MFYLQAILSIYADLTFDWSVKRPYNLLLWLNRELKDFSMHFDV